MEAVTVPRDTWASVFAERGTPVDRSAYRVEMLDAVNSWWIDFGVQGTEHVVRTIQFEDVLQSLVSRT